MDEGFAGQAWRCIRRAAEHVSLPSSARKASKPDVVCQCRRDSKRKIQSVAAVKGNDRWIGGDAASLVRTALIAHVLR